MSQHGPDEDPVDDANRALMGVLAGAAKATEAALRAHRDRARTRAGEASEQAADLDARYQANSNVAAQLLDRIDGPTLVTRGSAQEISTAWTVANAWADIDPDRFGSRASNINAAIETATGVDAGSLARLAGLDNGREELLRALREREESEEAAERHVADREHLNAQNELSSAALSTDPADAAVHRERAAIASTAEAGALTTATAHQTEAGLAGNELAAVRSQTSTQAESRTAPGVDAPAYDTPQRRAATAEQLRRAGAAPEAIKAHQMADLGNARPARQSVKLAAARAARGADASSPAVPQVALGADRATKVRRGR